MASATVPTRAGGNLRNRRPVPVATFHVFGPKRPHICGWALGRSPQTSCLVPGAASQRKRRSKHCGLERRLQSQSNFSSRADRDLKSPLMVDQSTMTPSHVFRLGHGPPNQRSGSRAAPTTPTYLMLPGANGNESQKAVPDPSISSQRPQPWTCQPLRGGRRSPATCSSMPHLWPNKRRAAPGEARPAKSAKVTALSRKPSSQPKL